MTNKNQHLEAYLNESFNNVSMLSETEFLKAQTIEFIQECNDDVLIDLIRKLLIKSSEEKQ